MSIFIDLTKESSYDMQKVKREYIISLVLGRGFHRQCPAQVLMKALVAKDSYSDLGVAALSQCE